MPHAGVRAPADSRKLEKSMIINKATMGRKLEYNKEKQL